MIRKYRHTENEKQQPATCLHPINAYKMSTTTALKSHTALLRPPTYNYNSYNGGCGRRNASSTAAPGTMMSSLAVDLCKGSKIKQTTAAPMEAAVVVNSIIYSKPSFCSIVVDIGDKESAPAAKIAVRMDHKDKDNKACILKSTALLSPTPKRNNAGDFPLLTTDTRKEDAQVYMMSTTMNGSIHHHISEICDNLIAMGLFGMENSAHDDDGLIEFAYDDADDGDDIQFLHSDEDYKRQQLYNDDYDDEDEDEDDDDEEEDYESDEDANNNVEDYETDEEDACLNECEGEDVTDFSRCPLMTRDPVAPLFNSEKKKKVRFNAKPTVHVMHTWDYAYRAARKGEWEMYARDRERFKLRIQRAALTLNPILSREHRQKVYDQRFAHLENAQNDEDDVEKALQQETPEPKKINQKPQNRRKKKKRKRRRPNF